jgi:predicted secreted protein
VTTAGAIVTFIVVWWLIFFMALPFGAAPEEHPQPGNVESAPARPRLLLKAAITTVLAAAGTWGIAQFLASGLIDLRPR